jgi:aerobic-type carbon monoxide dehydrogenase small subunit (CoxS/CutS family)
MAERTERIELRVNGKDHALDIDPSRCLLDVLRVELGLTGTKYGCGRGECGACAVLVDGEAVRSCILPVSRAHGRTLTTIEGLAKGRRLHPVQKAFLETQAFQCGYCTPGIIMSTVALLSRTPDPTELEIREGLAGHLCRCGAYARIIAAVQLAAKNMRTQS